MKEKILALLQRHRGTLASEIAEITRSVARLETISEADLVTLHRQVHTLKGSSGSLGFDAIFKSAERLEHRIKPRLGVGLQPSDIPDIRRDHRDLHALIDAARIEDSSLYAKFGLNA